MAVKHNLPAQTTSFVGRKAELAEVTDLLANPACRLLTLVGPGGIGKTRLALQAAAENLADFPDGVYFVALQPVIAAEFIAPTIAEAIGLSLFGSRPPEEQLVDSLRDRKILLVLDNFEHLLSGVPLLESILTRAAGTKLLVTSREILNMQEEWVRPIKGLLFPAGGSPRDLEAYSAVQLFVERARRVQADFSLERDGPCAARVCALLEGMPLAIELAAAWLKTLPCSQIAAEIQQNLDFLATRLRNVPERHRNVRAVFEQSWQLLEEPERRAFQRLAVFQSGFSRPAAEAVAEASLLDLQALVDKSLLRLESTGRYHIHELLRQFAEERLNEEPAEAFNIRERHSAFFTDFLSEQEDDLKGHRQMEALRRLENEIDNLRSAWQWAVEQQRADLIRPAMQSLVLYYQMRGRITEGAEAFQRALKNLPATDEIFSANLILVTGWFLMGVGRQQEADPLYLQAFPKLQKLESGSWITFPICAFSFHTDRNLLEWNMLWDFYNRGLLEAQARREDWGTAWFYYTLGILSTAKGEHAASDEYMQQSLEHFRKCGDRWGSVWALHHMGSMAVELDRPEEALPVFEESLKICQEIGDQGGIAFSLHFLGDIFSRLKEYEGSWHYLAQALRISWEMGSFMVLWHLIELASSLKDAGQKERAVELVALVREKLDAGSYEEDVKYVENQLAGLESELPEDVFHRARQRGAASDLNETIQAVLEEFSPATARDAVTPVAQPRASTQPGLVEPLSERELEVLRLVAAGLSNRAIASRLVVTVGTVKKHLNNVFGKLQVASRTEAVARARELNLLP